MIGLLVIGLLLILLIDLLLSYGDLFAPPCMLSIVYILCVIFSLYNFEFWNLRSFKAKTTAIILSAIVIFSVSYYAVTFLLHPRIHSKKRQPLTKAECTCRVISFQAKPYYLTVVFDSVVIVSCIWNILKIGTGAGWNEILANYKLLMYAGTAALPGYLNSCFKLITALSYVYLYVFINNMVMEGNFRRNKKYLLPVLLYVIRSVVTGNRYNLLCSLAAGVYCYYILFQLKTGWKRRFKAKYIIWGVLGLLITMVAFVMLKKVSGRTDNIDPIYYISMYAGGPIKLFDWYLESPPPPDDIWGKETFSGIINFLANRGIGRSYDINLEFRFIGNRNLGNVYGALRRYYHDYGYFGAMFLVMLLGVFWSIIYSKVTCYSYRNTEKITIIFLYMINTLMIMPIDDKFYTNLVTPSFIIHVLLSFILYRIIVRKKKVRYFYAINQ